MDVLQGRVAIVTGAAAGVGRGIALALAEAGSDVAILDVDEQGAASAVEEIAALSVRSQRYRTDVTDRAQVDASFDAVIGEFGGLDIVVNNAGISRVGAPTHEVTDEDWLDSIAVLQTGVFYCLRAAGRIMVPRGSGSVVNITSIRAFAPNVERITYCAPKAAVDMMTRVAAGEWGPSGVRVNAIAPGFLRTPMWERDVARGAIDEEALLASVPAGRLGTPQEVGRLVVFLCSDAAGYVSGSCITIDGGATSTIV